MAFDFWNTLNNIGTAGVKIGGDISSIVKDFQGSPKLAQGAPLPGNNVNRTPADAAQKAKANAGGSTDWKMYGLIAAAVVGLVLLIKHVGK